MHSSAKQGIGKSNQPNNFTIRAGRSKAERGQGSERLRITEMKGKTSEFFLPGDQAPYPVASMQLPSHIEPDFSQHPYFQIGKRRGS
jgi:hypothetical protein